MCAEMGFASRYEYDCVRTYLYNHGGLGPKMVSSLCHFICLFVIYFTGETLGILHKRLV